MQDSGKMNRNENRNERGGCKTILLHKGSWLRNPTKRTNGSTQQLSMQILSHRGTAVVFNINTCRVAGQESMNLLSVL
jgi:hypothetical protein